MCEHYAKALTPSNVHLSMMLRLWLPLYPDICCCVVNPLSTRHKLAARTKWLNANIYRLVTKYYGTVLLTESGLYVAAILLLLLLLPDLLVLVVVVVVVMVIN